MVISWLKSKIFSLKGYMLISITLMHLAILPVLYFTITHSYQSSSKEQFIAHAREATGLIADALTASNIGSDRDFILAVMDSALLGGKITYIDISNSNGIVLAPEDIYEFSQKHFILDNFIGDNQDDIYHLSMPLRIKSGTNELYQLRIGFDESQLIEEIENIKHRTILILILYLFVVIAFISFITLLILKPLRIIRTRSRDIASGNTNTPIEIQSRLSDITYLARDIETMRSSLIRLAYNMEHKATHDDLTNLPNRYLFMDRLHTATSLAHRHNKSFAVLLIDLNRFKEINDTLGHGTGDQVLKTIAERMTDEIRESDTLARLGGDEFSILLNDSAPIIAEKVAFKLIELIEQSIQINGHVLQVGASIGIAVFPDSGENAELLLQRADIAMYSAKNNNLHVASYHPDMDAHNYENLILLQDMRSSIQEGNFEAWFQPKYKLPEQDICGCELLLRWNHPTLGLIMPDKFIPIAEQENLIGDLTRKTIQDYLPLFRNILNKSAHFHISVNVSPNNLLDTSLFDAFDTLLRQNTFLKHKLFIEVTENAIMKNPIRSATILNKFIMIGIGVSVDDFGTGYSSLAYLQKFPISELKIDRSFISNLKKDSNNYPIVNASITMAHDLNITVVAEGTETRETLDLLIEMGCDCSQGYFHSKPVSFTTLQDMILGRAG